MVGRGSRTGKAVKRQIRYEQIILDTHYRRFRKSFSVFFVVLFQHYLKTNSVSKSKLSQRTKVELQPFAKRVELSTPGYSVALVEDNTAIGGVETFETEAEARDFVAKRTRTNRRLVDEWHVIPTHELAA